MVVLQTPRLILRHFVPEDLDALSALYRDPETRRYFPEGTLTRDETRRELEWFLHGHPRFPALGLWATIDRASGEFLGRCGLLPWEIDGRHEVEIAFLVDPSRQREGLATEAATALVDHAARVLRLRRVVCLVMPGNTASVRVAQKIGMVFEREFIDDLGPSLLYARALPAPPSEPGPQKL